MGGRAGAGAIERKVSVNVVMHKYIGSCVMRLMLAVINHQSSIINHQSQHDRHVHEPSQAVQSVGIRKRKPCMLSLVHI